MRLKALNHCKNNQIFLFIIIITKNFQGFSEKNMYFCIRNAALGNLKASFHCARLRFLCRNFGLKGESLASQNATAKPFSRPDKNKYQLE